MKIAHRDDIPIALKLAGKQCAEIGVQAGYFSAAILKQNPGRLWLIDPWKHQDARFYPDDPANADDATFEKMYHDVMSRLGCNPAVMILRDYSTNTAHVFPARSLDFVYIDAVHTYQAVLADMACWWGAVNLGGWLCGHDFTGRYEGVSRAVLDFCQLNGCTLGFVTMESWASWGIQKAG